MFAANDFEPEFYYTSTPPDLISTSDSDLEENNNVQEEDIETGNTETTDDLSNGRHYGDYNTINMELDGEYTSEDEEQRPRPTPASPGHAFQRLAEPYATRHHHRSSSQRSRGFSPLGTRFSSLRRQNAITSSFLTQHVKHNNELGKQAISGSGSKDLGQFYLPESSFLRAGLSFTGTQNLMNSQPQQRDEEWEVKVVNINKITVEIVLILINLF